MYRLLISIDLNVYTKLYKHMVYILKMYTYIYRRAVHGDVNFMKN